MAEGATVYDILVKIGVEEKVSAVFQTVASELSKIEGAFTRLNTTLPKTAESLGFIGGELMGISIALGAALFGASEIGNKGAEALAKFRLEGKLTNEELNKILAAAQSATVAVPGSVISGNIELLRELHGILGGDMEKAITLLPQIALFNRMTEGTGGVAAVQAVGGRTAGPEQLAQIDKYLDMILKISQASAGMVSPGQVSRAFTFGGLGAQQYSPEFMQNYLPRLLVDAGVSGGAGMGNIGRQLNQAMQEALKAQEGTKTRPPNELLQGVKVDIANPQLLAKGLAENLKAAGITAPADIAKALSEIFTGTRGARAGMPIYEMVTAAMGAPEEDRFKTMSKAVSEAPGMSPAALHEYMTASPVEQTHELAAALRNLGEAMGIPLARIRSEAMSHVIDLLNSISAAVVSVKPETMDAIVKVIAALTVGIGVIGAAIAGMALAAVSAPILITAAVAALGTLIALDWAHLSKQFNDLAAALGGLLKLGWDAAAAAIAKVLAALQALFGFLIKAPVPGVPGAPPPALAPGAPTTPAPDHRSMFEKFGGQMNFVAPGGGDGGGRLINASFNPGVGGISRPVMVAMTLNVDGRALAQAVSTQLANLSEHPTQAPFDDANRGFHSPDDQLTSV